MYTREFGDVVTGRTTPSESVVATGVRLLDEVLAGGVPPGATILALGEPASGMELVAKEFAARDGPAIFYSPEESAQEVEAVIRRFEPEAEPMVVDIASEYYDAILKAREMTRRGHAGQHLYIAAPGAQGPERPEVEFEAPDFLDTIFQEVIVSRPRRTVVDTLDFFFELYPPQYVIRAVRALRLANRDIGGLLYLGKMKRTAEAHTEALLEHIADIVLEFTVDRERRGYSWRLDVKKVRNAPQRARSMHYQPTSEGVLVRDSRGRV